jgi:hypothetical protein
MKIGRHKFLSNKKFMIEKNQTLKNINLIYLIVIFFLVSCKTKESNIPIKYDNIIIFSDLSNRLDRTISTNLPASDTIVINRIIDFFVSDCVKPGIKNNDRSSILYSFLNPISYNLPKSKIDLEEEFPNVSDIKSKQAYVNNTCQTKNISCDIIDLKLSIKRIYNNYKKFSNNYGLDILNLINDKIKNSNLIKKTVVTHTELGTSKRLYDNHLFIFTDGYLEYYSKGAVKSRYFDYKKIETIRDFCIKKKCYPKEAIDKYSYLPRLPHLFSIINKDIALYIMETNDRHYDKNTGSNLYENGLTDNDILKAVWKKWAKDSGFKKFVWQKINLNQNEINLNYVKNIVRQKNGFVD